ncbi:patatin-like phospholipase family protein [Bradyrhizobium septentrionale]|uniref:Patatin-like phospholipase family protein n=1 Tax=Bradyrhizobium septentrionale TaxID=1404411 RepID=A0A973VV40_9BRAD|nr:patatin-like phospholipase family protein [Bradyrhizobium septentrionale]UGY19612.1 patatin-like phospholipase family protein [Bradyrhizobium septentrionale]UGY28378.1 patatin-like phospholipase family protein [Bradyrhizobium septentrionale]
MPKTKQQHFDRDSGPKRILALDGGGIRGILTLEYLAAVEATLRERYRKDDLLLCDYFDLIGGTSTGSIIAAGLACGMTVDALKKLYRGIGTDIFQGSFWRRGLLAPKFKADALQRALDAQLGADTALGGDRIRTGLMIMTKRLDTGSPWPLHNHPEAPYAKQDGALRLTEVVRASTAAPTYFEPQKITISARNGSTVSGAFVDGGVSPFNDPALQLLMLAALHGHGFRWHTGTDKLLLISAGTGVFKSTFSTDEIVHMPAAEQGLRSLQSLMDDCGRHNHGMLQWLTNCLTPRMIDRAVEDMVADSHGGPQLATYARYNVLLETDWLKKTIAIDRTPDALVKIAAMDNPNNMDELAEIGRLAAIRQVKPDHFPPAFDIK